MVAAIMGVAGGELLIPTIVLLFGGEDPAEAAGHGRTVADAGTARRGSREPQRCPHLPLLGLAATPCRCKRFL
ncbi:hypothetical protein WDA79_13420 [Streptomyces sp. A475]